MKKVENVLIGADPELFIKKDGEIISAEGTIGGSKHSPVPIIGEGYAIQEDNVMVEFNIPACSTKESFSDAIGEVLDYLEVKYAMDNATLEIIPSARLDQKFLNTKQAKLFGCEPDFNVYLKDVNKSPSSKTNLRVCGGHIHIGYSDPSFSISEEIVQAMDIVLGLESVLLDTDTERKKMYGKAGSFRPKEYGVEYRTLSNFWIKTQSLREWAFTSTMKAIELVNEGSVSTILEKYQSSIIEAINTNNKDLATKLINEINYKKITV